MQSSSPATFTFPKTPFTVRSKHIIVRLVSKPVSVRVHFVVLDKMHGTKLNGVADWEAEAGLRPAWNKNTATVICKDRNVSLLLSR